LSEERTRDRLKPNGLWLYASTLPADLEVAFELQRSGEAPSRNQDFERYTRWPDQQARWLFRHARRLRAQIWEALLIKGGVELGGLADQRAMMASIMERSEEERKALLSGLVATLKVEAWSEALSAEWSAELPPMRYEIELRPASYLTLYLSPIVHLAITRVDPELGRSIGDALDGPPGV